MQVDAARQRRPRQALGQRRAADDHLPARQVDLIRPLCRQQHRQYGRHAMREGDAMLCDQTQQLARLIAPGIDLPHPQHGGDQRKTPAVNVEQRRQRHVDIVALDAAPPRHRRQTGNHPQRMQHQLAVAIGHPLGVTRRAGGIEQRGPRRLGQVGKGETRRSVRQQRLIFAGKALGHGASPVRQQDQPHGPRDAGQQGQKHGQKILMHQNGVVPGMVDRVEDLLGRQPHVDGVQRRPQHRNGKEAFQIAVAVVIHHRHHRALPQAQARQHRPQPRDPLAHLGISHLDLIAMGDALRRRRRQPGVQQLPDDQLVFHGILPPFWQSIPAPAAIVLCRNAKEPGHRCPSPWWDFAGHAGS